MLDNKVRGEVTYILREIGTDEIVDQKTVTNVFTDVGLEQSFWASNQSVPNTIMLAAQQKLPSNNYTPALTMPGQWFAIGSTPSGYTSPNWGEPVAPNSWYVEIMNRFNPPSTAKNINLIALVYNSGSDGSTYINGSMIAYVNLPYTLSQSTTQYLDIYYRVYFPQTTTLPLSSNLYRQIVRDKAIGAGTFNYSMGPLARYMWNIYPVQSPSTMVNKNGIPVDVNLNFYSVGSLNPINGSGYGALNYTSGISIWNGAPGTADNWDMGTMAQTWSFAAATQPGVLMNYCTAGLASSKAYMTQMSQFPVKKNSPIQNIFRHSATSTSLPFLDVSNLATSQGNVIPSGSWTTPTSPEMYFVEIVTGGAVGTATYRYKKRKILNLNGNAYQYIGTPLPNFTTEDNTMLTSDPVVPSLTQFTSQSDYDQHLSSTKAFPNGTEFVAVFADHVIHHNILTGVSTMFSATLYPTFTPTNISQIEIDSSGNIWVACSNTGLYQISSGGVITVFGTAQGLPAGGCYGVHLGKSPSAGVDKLWAVFNGAVASVESTNWATWTQYTPTSSPAFSISGISDANWNTVAYIRVDKNTDQMLLIRNATTTVSPTMVGVWWSPTTSATPLNILTNASSPTMGDYRVHQQLLNVSDNTSFWAVCINDGMHNARYMQLTPGTSNLDYLGVSATGEPALLACNFEYDYNFDEDRLVIVYPTYSAQSSAFLTRTVAAIAKNSLVTGDPAFSQVSTLLPLDGNSYNGSLFGDVVGLSTLSGSANVTIANTSPFGSGVSSASFDGVSSYLTYQSSSMSMSAGQWWTLECWFNAANAQTSTYPTLISNQYSSWTNGAFHLVTSHPSYPGHVVVEWWPVAYGNATFRIVSPNTVTTGVWHHVAVSFDGTYGMQLFIDGVSQGTAAVFNPTSAVNFANGNFAIGGNNMEGANGFFAGEITNIRLTHDVARYLPNSTPTLTARLPQFNGSLTTTTYAIPELTSDDYNILWRGKFFSTNSTVSPTTSVGDTYTFLRLNRGEYLSIRRMVVTAVSPSISTMAIGQLISGIGLDNTYSGGNAAVIADYQYGWNGANWVLGASTALTTSNVSTVLENGLSVTFQNGGTPSQAFVAGDFFNFAVTPGILKDTVSTLQFNTTSYVKTVKTNQTISGITVLANTAAITANTVQTAYSDLSANVTINANNQVVLTGAPGDYAVMDYPFTGNFDVTIDFTSVATQPYGAKFGLGIGKRLMYGISMDANGVEYQIFRHPEYSFGGLQYVSNAAYNGRPLPTQEIPLQTVRFTRTGYGSGTSTITMYVNGTSVHSESDAQYTNGNVYQLLFRSYLPTGNATPMGTVTISSADANPPLAKIGTLSSKSGAYDPYFFGFDATTTQLYTTITINGSAAINAYNSFNTNPNPGEISVDQSGFVKFNVADIGKTVGGTYMYLQDVGII